MKKILWVLLLSSIAFPAQIISNLKVRDTLYDSALGANAASLSKYHVKIMPTNGRHVIDSLDSCARSGTCATADSTAKVPANYTAFQWNFDSLFSRTIRASGAIVSAYDSIVPSGAVGLFIGKYDADEGGELLLNGNDRTWHFDNYKGKLRIMRHEANNGAYKNTPFTIDSSGNIVIGYGVATRTLTLCGGTGATNDAYFSYNNSVERWLTGLQGTGLGAGNDNSYFIYGSAYHFVLNPNGGIAVGLPLVTPPANGLIMGGKLGVGVATTAGLAQLTVRGTYAAFDGGVGKALLDITSTNAAAVDAGGTLQFNGATGESTSPYGFAAIKGAKASAVAGNYGGYLAFYTTPAASGMTERMRISSAGDVTIASVTDATSTTAASVMLAGGLGVAKTAWIDSLVVVDKIRCSSTKYRRYYHMPPQKLNPGASGGTWVNPGANTTGGWQITSATHTLNMQADIYSDWDAASDLKVEVYFAVGAAGVAGNTIDLRALCYYNAVGDVATKTQTVEVPTTVDGTQYKVYKATFTINFDETDNVVEAGDIISFLLNLETDTSEIDNAIILAATFYYNTTHIGIEDGDT